MSTGTLPCGLTAKNSGGLGPQRVLRVQGICNISYSRPFSARAIRTLVLKGLRTPDHSFMDDLFSASQVTHAACQCGLPLSGSQVPFRVREVGVAAHEKLGIDWVLRQLPACLADAGGQLGAILGLLDVDDDAEPAPAAT